jgi:hypothetical protein
MNADGGGAALPEARLSVHARCLGFLPALVRLRSLFLCGLRGPLDPP